MKFTLLFFSYSLFLSAQQPSNFETVPAFKEQTDWGNRKKQLEKSFKLWLQLKNDCQGNYSYTKKWSSWTGFGHTTTINVSKNRVIERKFESIGPPNPDGKPVDKNRWTERGGFIGSNPKGYPPRTMDELYREARSLMERPIPPFHQGILRFNEQGLVLSCFIQDTRIADDAPIQGINITTITLEENKNTEEIKEKPSFDQWLQNGKKIPEGMMFIGGSPWFDERTGKNRKPREVYDMIFKNKKNTLNSGVSPNRKPPVKNKRKPFPKHWGDPPQRQTRDLRPLPGGYGMGSGTLARWIQENLDRDKIKDTKSD